MKLSGLPRVKQLARMQLGEIPIGLAPGSVFSRLSCPAHCDVLPPYSRSTVGVC